MAKSRWNFAERKNHRGERSLDNLQNEKKRWWNIHLQGRKYSGVSVCRDSTCEFSPLRFKVRPPQEVTTASFGSTLRLPCVAESGLRPRITWTRDGKFSLPGQFFVLQNGTLVIQNIRKSHQGYYTCRATNAVKTIEAKVKINSPVTAASCSEIRKHVRSGSGNYVIDPDGKGGLAPFSVYCDMNDKKGVGVTVISHDSVSRTFVNPQ